MNSPFPGMDPYLEQYWGDVHTSFLVYARNQLNVQDAVLQLQPILDACYRDGRYQQINYRVDPVPRLGEDDAAWIDRLLRDHGRR